MGFWEGLGDALMSGVGSVVLTSKLASLLVVKSGKIVISDEAEFANLWAKVEQTRMTQPALNALHRRVQELSPSKDAILDLLNSLSQNGRRP